MNLWDQIKINIREDKIIHTQVKTRSHKRSSSLEVSSRSGSRIFKGKGGYRERRRCELSRGVWGHAPPENFENSSL